jgi:phage FluMu protein gp41
MLTYERLEPAAALPVQRETERNLLPLQQWEGVVTRVSADEFTVTLQDLTHPGSPEEEATVPMAEVTREDRRLLVPGAVLYWSIGYQTIRTSGQIQRVSDIRLRRLPAWSARDLDRVAQRARALRDKFGSNDADDATSIE